MAVYININTTQHQRLVSTSQKDVLPPKLWHPVHGVISHKTLMFWSYQILIKYCAGRSYDISFYGVTTKEKKKCLHRTVLFPTAHYKQTLVPLLLWTVTINYNTIQQYTPHNKKIWCCVQKIISANILRK